MPPIIFLFTLSFNPSLSLFKFPITTPVILYLIATFKRLSNSFQGKFMGILRNIGFSIFNLDISFNNSSSFLEVVNASPPKEFGQEIFIV